MMKTELHGVAMKFPEQFYCTAWL